MYSDYKHHTTFKVLIGITPNGAVSYVSECYGGRASDLHVVRNSGFLDFLAPRDEVMADRGFKIKTDLTMRQCTLSIPPSAASGNKMLSSDCQKTSSVANVRIFVEKAIKLLKDYRILKHEVSLRYVPIFSDIVKVCAALCNLKKPLKE